MSVQRPIGARPKIVAKPASPLFHKVRVALAMKKRDEQEEVVKVLKPKAKTEVLQDEQEACTRIRSVSQAYVDDSSEPMVFRTAEAHARRTALQPGGCEFT